MSLAARMISAMGQGFGFIGSSFDGSPSAGATLIDWPVGTMAGDMALIWSNDDGNTPTISTSGWDDTPIPTFGGSVRTKILSAADLSATIDITNATASFVLVFVFRGFAEANALTVQAEQNTVGGNTKNWTGFTKGANCRAFLIFYGASASGAGIGAPLDFDAPTLSNAQVGFGGSWQAGNIARAQALYDLTPGDYANGTTITVIGYGADWDQRALVAFELT